MRTIVRSPKSVSAMSVRLTLLEPNGRFSWASNTNGTTLGRSRCVRIGSHRHAADPAFRSTSYTTPGSHAWKLMIRPSPSLSVMVSAALTRRRRRSHNAALQSAERGIMRIRSGSSGSAYTVMKLHPCV